MKTSQHFEEKTKQTPTKSLVRRAPITHVEVLAGVPVLPGSGT